MESQYITTKNVPDKDVKMPLRETLKSISENCTECGLCVAECAFLAKYGTPKKIADTYDPLSKQHQGMPFECSLCQLCAAVCPVGLSPGDMFMGMRREIFSRGGGNYQEYSPILGYERRGSSQRFSYYTLPVGCDTIFFPGCTLPGTRPDKVMKLYEYLKKSMPTLGIVLDCCMKPSHDLGREEQFKAMFHEMRDFLFNHGITKVLVACPNCFKVFKKYGGNLSVMTVYEVLEEIGLPNTGSLKGSVTVHDPCPLRFEGGVHAAVRGIIEKRGLSVEEMEHSRTETLCCGEGGMVGFVSPELSQRWGALRAKEARGKRVFTYCAGCANLLNHVAPTSHVLDLMFDPEATMTGTVKVSRSPVTYWNRMRLKSGLKKMTDGGVTRERTFIVGAGKKKSGMMKFILFLLFIAGTLLAVKLSGASRYFEQETLGNWIHGYGSLAPVIYMLVYSLAPAFFLPGLPITIVGGILFGPFWGVVYTITSATTGACVAFLVSRYLAREWVENKLTSPRWQRLDERVEQHGWKVVALTRLIPLFPFNLLNYAFGLTKVRFLDYAVTTFLCMLPACIAFIVFSSSLPDLLIKGRISSGLLIGMGLIVAVSLFPLLYRRYRAKKGDTTPL